MGKLFGYSETDKHKIYTILGIKTSLKKKSTQNNTINMEQAFKSIDKISKYMDTTSKSIDKISKYVDKQYGLFDDDIKNLCRAFIRHLMLFKIIGSCSEQTLKFAKNQHHYNQQNDNIQIRCHFFLINKINLT